MTIWEERWITEFPEVAHRPLLRHILKDTNRHKHDVVCKNGLTCASLCPALPLSLSPVQGNARDKKWEWVDRGAGRGQLEGTFSIAFEM